MFNSLKSKFIISFLTVQVVFIALIVSINFNSLNEASKTLIDEKIEASSELISELIKTPLIVSDLATIDDAVASFSKIKNVTAISVYDAHDNVISSYIKDNTLPADLFSDIDHDHSEVTTYNDQKYSSYAVDVNVEGEVIGHIHFIFNNTQINTIIQKNNKLTYTLIFLAIIAGFLLAYVIASRLSRSLEKLTRITQNVANDEYVEIKDSSSNDEVGQLFSAMKIMQEHIMQRTKKLNKSLNDLQQLMIALDKSILVSKTDTKGFITYANDRFCEVSGYSREELVGVSHNIVRDPEIDASFFKELWDTIKAKKIFHSAFRNIAKDGSYYYVDATIFPIFDSNGNVYEYIAIRYDITELVDAKDKALAAKKAKEDFLANMSHEIRTPMNAIIGFVQILLENTKDQTSISYLNIINDSSQTLLHIINDILDFSKIESGKLVIDKHAFNPVKEFSQASKLFTIKAKEKSIKYISFIDPNIPECLEGDLTRIKQIVFNFLSNSFKFTAKDKSVILRVTYDRISSVLNIDVSDEGIGLSDDQQAKIFNAFEQADTSTSRKYGGTGLGLTISLKLAKMMDGEIRLKSKKDKGSTFSLSVPLNICTDSDSDQENKKLYSNCHIGFTNYNQSDTIIIDHIKESIKGLQIDHIDDSVDPKSSEDDIIIFIPDGKIEEYILNSKKPAIALIQEECDKDCNNTNITSIVTPYTSFDIMNAINKLYLNKENSLKQQSQEQIKIEFSGSILVAEDNRTNQMLISIILDEYMLDFTIVNDGIEAVDAFKSSKFDLVLMDENMPNMTGVEALREIREYEIENSLEKTPVIALTANVMEDDKKYFIDEGMNDFLAKPIDTNELERVFKEFLT